MDDRAFQSEGVGGTKPVIDNPLVSIITPVLNGIKYLEECIQNVLTQTYPCIEHIFVDGGSADGTLDVLADYKARYPERIRFVSEPDRGVGEALNKGLKMAKGEIIGWLDSDDLYELDAIMIAVEFFNSNPETYFVFGGCNIINEDGVIIEEVPIRDFNFKALISGKNHISLGAAFYRRKVIERVGYFNTVGNNFDFCVRVAQQFQMHRIEKTLANWRTFRDSVGFSKEASKLGMIKQKLREDYLLCKQYGGGILAPRCRKYFIFIILNKLGLFHFVNLKVRLVLRRYRFTGKVLRMFGG